MKNVNGLMVLESQDFQRTCPSFYAEHPKEGVSEKYSFVSSRNVACALWGMGWYPVSAKESRSVDPSNKGFTKHLVRYAHKDMTLGGERIELVVVNSHNRASAFQLMAGIFRLVCSNGLIIKTSDFGTFKVRHLGDIRESVEFAVNQISGQAGMIAGRMDAFKAIDLTLNEQGVYAASAMELLYADPKTAPIASQALLNPLRYSDASEDGTYVNGRYVQRSKSDLWTTFNTVQENILKGKIRGRNPVTHNRVSTRAIQSIDKDVKLNQALWALTERMAALKTAAAPAA